MLHYVYSVCETADGKIWFGTSNGICHYDGAKFTSVTINIPGDTTVLPDNSPGHEFRVDQYGFPPMEDAVWDIKEDRNGRLWFGTAKGAFYYDGRNFSHFTVTDGVKNNTPLTLKNVEHLLEDRDGNFWFGGRLIEGGLRYDGKMLTSYEVNANMWVWPLMQDATGNIWFSNWGGVYYSDGKSFTNKWESDAMMNDVTSMLQDHEGNFWFTCDAKESGVAFYDGKSLVHYGKTEGVPTNVWSVLEDKDGNIWFGTRNNGLYMYDGRTFTCYSE